MKKIFSIFAIFLLSFSLTACGFHLRGHEPLPPQLKVLYLETPHLYSPMTKELQRVLRTVGITLTSCARSAPITLQIISDNFTQSSTSVGSGGQVTTFVLSNTIVFQLLNSNGQVILPPQTIIATRNYAITSNVILSNVNAVTSLQEEMRRDLVYQLLDRLRAPIVLHAICQM